MTDRTVIGYRDETNRLHQLLLEDCKRWTLAEGGELFRHNGQFILLQSVFAALGSLARPVSRESAAELLLGSGHALHVIC